MPLLRGFAAAVLILAASSALPVLAAGKEPPVCAAISFRPVPSGPADGEQDAGLYHSRFGRIEVKATVKSGEPQNYFVEIDGKKLDPVTGALPAQVVSCTKIKRLSPPEQPASYCTGDHLRVLISHSGEDRYILLYGMEGKASHFCSAGKT